MLPIKDICSLFGKSRQAWYEAQKRNDTVSMQDFIVIEHIKELRKEMPRIGLGKLFLMLLPFLSQHQIKLGRDKLADLLREKGLLVKEARRANIRTTFSRHGFFTYDNLLKIKHIVKPNQA